jgi:hypothetical protein
VHVACSGASIHHGLIGEFKKGIPLFKKALPPQITQVEEAIGGRPIDALLVSIGANDIGFADILRRCVARPRCWRSSKIKDHLTKIGALSNAYVALAACISGSDDRCTSATHEGVTRSLHIGPHRVFITEYFDPTRDEHGDTCPRILVGIGRKELNWAREQVILPLNRAVANASSDHNWLYVGGIFDAFRTHGYCSERSWIVKALEAGIKGALHPNGHGQKEGYGLPLWTRLRQDFYLNGRIRSP